MNELSQLPSIELVWCALKGAQTPADPEGAFRPFGITCVRPADLTRCSAQLAVLDTTAFGTNEQLRAAYSELSLPALLLVSSKEAEAVLS